MCVEHGPYAVSMENKCKMTIKHSVLNYVWVKFPFWKKGLKESYLLYVIFPIHKMDILKVVIQLSGRFFYPDDFAEDQSVRINEVRLYICICKR
jgi:hypothetical protein